MLPSFIDSVKWRRSAGRGGGFELPRSARTRAWAALSVCASPEKRKKQRYMCVCESEREREKRRGLGGSVQTQEISALLYTNQSTLEISC